MSNLRRCNYCQKDTETKEEDCVDCGFSKTWESLEKETIVLSKKDWDKLMDHIENPPEPTEAFKKAMKEYRERFGK